MRMLVITGALTALSTAVVWNAYEKKQQFYPTVVYLMNSNRAMGVRTDAVSSALFTFTPCTMRRAGVVPPSLPDGMDGCSVVEEYIFWYPESCGSRGAGFMLHAAKVKKCILCIFHSYSN